MNLQVINWVIPIILELFKRSDRYPGYFKRNKTVAMLLMACLVSLALSLFMFEQAILHGVNSKIHKKSSIELASRLDKCETTKEASIAACGQPK